MKITAGMDDDRVDSNSDDEDVRIPSNKIGEKSGTNDQPILSFTPQQAHIFGGQSIFLSFVDIDTPLNNDVFYYVVFKGSKMQHITSAKVLNPYTLQAVIPDHNDAELVILSVCQYASDSTDLYPDNNVMATDTFVYTSDSSQFLTQQLASNADNPANLLDLQSVYSSLLDISLEDKKSLDYKLTTSFRNLLLPTDWSLISKAKEDEKSWTLLHFCAKYNFPMLAEYLLVKSGAKDALKTLDERNHTPVDIAKFTKHKKMIEVLSRIPCEEEVNTELKKEIKRPTVKRHKLGTTTFTNEVSEDKAVTVKDLMILKELDTLATTSRCTGSTEITDEHYPLAESLRKLHEINEEIRRLRSITKDISDTLDTEDNYETESFLKDTMDMCNGEYFIEKNRSDSDKNRTDSDLDLLDVINNGVQEEVVDDSLNDNSSENSNEMQSSITEKNANPIDIEDINLNIVDKHETNGSLDTVTNLVTKNSESILREPEEFSQENVVATDMKQDQSLENGTNNNEPCAQSTDANNADDSSYKLESVTEETEEELNVDDQRRQKSSKAKKHAKNAAEVVSDLPPAPKRVGILRKSSKRKDNRPWSDSFDNIRKVDKEGIGFYQDGMDTCDGKFSRGHSLDALLDSNICNTPHSRKASAHDHLGSQESLSSDNEFHRSSDSGSRHRFDSDKSLGTRSLSLLSLNEIPKKSLFRWSFKKAKSMTSLETKENNQIKFEDRRQTISATDNLNSSPENRNSSKGQDYTDTQQDTMYGDIRVHCESYEDNRGLKTGSLAAKTSKDVHSDEETDEGISREIGEQNGFERKSSANEKQKRLFGILPRGSSKFKERKGSKEKIRDRKDTDGKQSKKKIPTSKHEVANNNLDLKSSFLSQRGSSFRRLTDSKSTSLQKSSASVTKNPLLNRPKSPTLSRKFNPMENAERGNDVYDSSSLLHSKALSTSRTSLDSFGDDIDAPFTSFEDEYDSDIDNLEEPETWSELVDKKVQRKMQKNEIKKQDVIYELIQTEALYLKTLQIMKKIYSKGMIRYLGYEQEVVNSMFPVLDDLIDLNGNFYRAMKKEQGESIHYCIENIGDVIFKTFDGDNGQLFKEKYGYFCSHHLEAVALYKELYNKSKNLAKFEKDCIQKERTRRLTIQECITYVTIRITKYPLLIEAIIKATKESSPDYEKLKKSLNLIKEMVMAVNEEVETHAQEKELNNLKRMIDRKNVVEIKQEPNKGIAKYKASKIFHKRSRLLYDKKVTLKSKNKSYETRMVILADKIIFFQENGGKLQLLNVDNKMPYMFLKGVMVREVATDIKALFLMNTSKESVEIYEISFDKGKEKTEFKPKIQQFIANCPDEEEENLTDNEEEARREEEERMLKLKDVMKRLDEINEEISHKLGEKNRIVLSLRTLLESMDEDSPVKVSPCMELKPQEIFDARTHLEDCLSKVNTALLLSNVNDCPTQPLVQNNNPNILHIAPKKSDTFSGFERTKSLVVSRSGSAKQLGRPELDVIVPNKTRRQSQVMNVFYSRNKNIGSTEDLSSLSSSSSLTSISSMQVPALTQVQVYQQLSERLGTLVEVTNKQDLELARMRNKLQESSDVKTKMESELTELRDKLVLQQKESDRQLRNEKDNFAKLSREFKRSKEKNQQKLVEQQQRQKLNNSEESVNSANVVQNIYPSIFILILYPPLEFGFDV